MSRLIPLVTLCALTATAIFAGQDIQLFLVDFEEFPEGTPISDQYALSGITFALADNPAEFPIIAIEGSPTLAFGGAGADNPMSAGVGGLTDPLVGNDSGVPRDIAMNFDPPVTGVRFFVIDIDVSDVFTVSAYHDGNLIASQTRTAGEPGTGNAFSSEFSFQHTAIDRIVVDAPMWNNIGYAIDFITFTRPCLGIGCGPLIEIAQESAPNADDFDTQVLGFLKSYPTSLTPTSFYGYGVPEGDSWNGPLLAPNADRSHLLLAETLDGIALTIVHDRAIPNDPDGGRAEMNFEVFNDPDGADFLLRDDPTSPDAYFGPTNNLLMTKHEWNTCCTDGVMIGGLDENWSMILSFDDADGNTGNATIAGLHEWVAYSADGSTIPLALEESRRVRLRALPDDLGDLNCDGVVSVSDIGAFVLALTNPVGYAAQFPDCNPLNGDFNEDGFLTVGDIGGFVQFLTN